MWFLWELVRRAWDSSVSSMGTTTLAIVGSLLFPLVDNIRVFREYRLEGMKSHWKKGFKHAFLIAVCWWAALFSYHLFYKVPHDIKVEAESVPVPPSPLPPRAPAAHNGVSIPPQIRRPEQTPHPTPCTMRGGTYYPDARMMPGGPNLKRPMFEVEGFFNNGLYQVGGRTLFLLEFALINHGERSIVRDWELCLVRDNKPMLFQVGAIPDGGITLDGEKITKEKSLTEDAIQNPIEHGERRVGWVAFVISPEVAQGIADYKQRVGSLRYKDYLAHEFSQDFVGTPEKQEYVPGKTK